MLIQKENSLNIHRLGLILVFFFRLLQLFF